MRDVPSEVDSQAARILQDESARLGGTSKEIDAMKAGLVARDGWYAQRERASQRAAMASDRRQGLVLSPSFVTTRSWGADPSLDSSRPL